MGARTYNNSLYYLLNFSYESKTGLKNKVYLKNRLQGTNSCRTMYFNHITLKLCITYPTQDDEYFFPMLENTHIHNDHFFGILV